MFGTYSLRMIVFSVLLIFSRLAGAEVVEHHGQKAESNSSHLECLTCHDGALAHSIQYCSGDCDGNFLHPVNRKYPPRGKELEFASVGQLNGKGIKLHNNKVSCISCHNLKNSKKNHPAEVRDLCRSCHIKK